MPQAMHRRRLFAGGAAALTSSLGLADPGALSVRDFGARGDGNTDDTDALRRAHASDRPLWYPRTSAFYRVSGPIDVRQDVASDGAMLRCRQDGSLKTSIFMISDNPRPLRISGLAFDGGYGGGKAGEWSMGIALLGAQNITIENNVFLRPYGDCVYLGNFQERQVCRSIVIRGNRMFDPRRCCIAVVCAHGVRVQANEFRKHHDYVAVVDLEPDRNGFDRVTDVMVQDNVVDSVTAFVRVSAFNSIPTTGVVIRRNRGRADELLDVRSSARLVSPLLVGNDIRTGCARQPR